MKAHAITAAYLSNALKIVQNILLKHEEIIFVPDKYLAQFVSAQVGCKFIRWARTCPAIYVKNLPENIVQAKIKHPQAKVLYTLGE